MIQIGQNYTVTAGIGESVGIIRFGTQDKTFELINGDSGDFNSYIHAGNFVGVNTGNFNWIYGQTNQKLMSLTYDGKLGINKPDPEVQLDVVGVSTFTGSVLITGNLEVDGDLIGGNTTLPPLITGSDIYKTQSGTKVLKIVLNSNDWLDPSTVRLMFDLKNVDADAAKRLRTISGPWSFWRRLRIMCGGTLIEDFDYNKTHELYCSLKPAEEKTNDDIEGFTYRVDNLTAHDATTIPGIAGGSYMTVSMKILSGVLNQPKFLPLRHMSGD